LTAPTSRPESLPQLKLAIIALLAITFAAGNPAVAEPVKLRIGWVVPVTNLASILFAKEGIARNNGKSYVIETSRFQGSTQQITALATGDLDFALLGFTSLPYAIENAGMTDARVVIGELQDGAPGYYSHEFFTLTDGPIKTIADLKGRVLATNAFGSAVDIAMRVQLKKHGLEFKRDYTVVEASFPAMKAMLAEKKVDLIPGVLPFSMDPELRRIGRPLFTQADAIGIGELGTWTARANFLASKRVAVVDFMEDYLRAVRFYTDPANHNEAIEIAANFSKLPPAVFDTWLFTHKDYYRNLKGLADANALQATFTVQRELGFLKTDIDAKKYLDLSLIGEAANRLN
jgi:NitT/TauT family transport system substrate-binding protein